MIQVNITYELREKLEQDWYGEYSSCTRFYPFFMWTEMKHNGKLVRNIPEHPFALEFKTQEEADKFIKFYEADIRR